MRLSFLPFIMLIVPIAEITTFVLVGGEIGVLWTIACILFTAVLGAFLLRVEGLRTFASIQSKMQAGAVPGRELGNGAMILVAGVLLLTPGFLTDAIGFSLFVPFVRDIIWNFIASRVKFKTFGQAGANPYTHPDFNPDQSPGQKPACPDVIDLDAEDFHIMDRDDPKARKSPWKQ